MKAYVMSDLHLDHYKEKERKLFYDDMDSKMAQDQPEIVILAGDIAGWYDASYSILKKCFKFFESRAKKTIMVSGNHCHWGTWFDVVEERKLQNHSEKLHMLDPERPLEYNGFKFGGGTLWYKDQQDDFGFIDYRRIYDPGTIFTKHQEFLDKVDLGSDIIVSHHFPTDESIAEQWKQYPNNAYFCAYIDEHLAKAPKLPKLWIHGHTHGPFDYVSRHGFRVYCNPYGYKDEGVNPGFWDKLLVEL